MSCFQGIYECFNGEEQGERLQLKQGSLCYSSLQFLQLKLLIVHIFSARRARKTAYNLCKTVFSCSSHFCEQKSVCVELSPPSGKIGMIKIKSWRFFQAFFVVVVVFVFFFVSCCAFVGCCGIRRSNRTDEPSQELKLINAGVI